MVLTMYTVLPLRSDRTSCARLQRRGLAPFGFVPTTTNRNDSVRSQSLVNARPVAVLIILRESVLTNQLGHAEIGMSEDLAVLQRC